MPDSGSAATALPLSSLQAAHSSYTEGIDEDPGASHTTTTFLSILNSEDVDGNVVLETVDRITASTNLNWDLEERSESRAGNYGTNSRKISNGLSTYDGVHEEVTSSVTDPNQEGEYLTTAVVTDNFVTHAEDYSYNDIRYGGSNQLSAGWMIDLHLVQIGDHVVDTEVDVESIKGSGLLCRKPTSDCSTRNLQVMIHHAT